MKSTISITLDAEIILELRKRKENISGVINSFLVNYLELNKKKIPDKIEQLKEDILKNKAELALKEKTLKELNKKEINERGIPFKIGN